MNLSKKELNKLKSSILKRDLFIYQDIENEMKRLKTKETKIAYFNQELNERGQIQVKTFLANKDKDYLEHYSTQIKTFLSHRKLTLDFNAINSLPDDERIYVYALFDQYSERYLFDENGSYLISGVAIPHTAISKNVIEGKEEFITLEAIQEISEFFNELSYPIDGKEQYERLSNKLVYVDQNIRTIEPSFWEKTSDKTAYVKIDFSQPIDVIIEVIKGIKKIIDQDKHNILTTNLYEAYTGKKLKEPYLQLDDLLKKRNTIFSLEEKLTDIIYIYDCKKNKYARLQD